MTFHLPTWPYQLFQIFPEKDDMVLKKSLKEDKFVSAQMDLHNGILEEVLFAFQQPEVVNAIHEITGIPALEPDEKLYAGGLSRMGKNQYLKPHLDNSHDKDRERYRVLNLLYYVSPDWKLKNGETLNFSRMV